jgi:hypothetical protein
MNRLRCKGALVSTGTYAAPAFNTPNTHANVAIDLRMCKPILSP